MYTSFLADAHALIEVIKLGSITALSNINGEHRATISKRISRIEDHLDVKIIKFNKANQIQLTKQGMPIYFNLKHLVSDLEFKFDKLSETYSKANHNIKFLNSIDTYNSFGVNMVANIINKNPSITIEAKAYTQYQLMSFGNIFRFFFNGIDIVALSEDFLHLIDDKEWILKKRLITKKKIYASRDYIKNNSNMTEISDISRHPCVINKYEDPNYWALKDENDSHHKVKINPYVSIDTFNLQKKILESNLGIGLLPESVVRADPGQLEQVFPNLSGREIVANILVNKNSLEKKPILNKIVKDILKETDALNLWEN